MPKIVIKEPTSVRVTREVTHHIKAWRLHRELSVDKLGELAGVSGSMVSQLERGKTTYTETTLEKLARALAVQPWQLLACGPDENKQLWNFVLAGGEKPARLEEFSSDDRLVLQEMLMNNCDAAIKTARSIAASRSKEPTKDA